MPELEAGSQLVELSEEEEKNGREKRKHTS
jgi:hypothetical protein